MSDALHTLTAHAALDKLNKREISSEELTRSVLDRIEKVDGSVRAYHTVVPEQALETARSVDRARAKGEDPGSLAGLPIAIKDNICTRGLKTSCASRMLENFIPPYDAGVTGKVKKAGAVIIGKTNLDEFAMGSSTENSAFGATRNPWDLSRVPGGSSGGSAAAVAADETILCLGSDTGGSIRQPASFCGVVGIKPTYGRVSRYGLVAFGSSLDQIGPLAKDVTDAALLLGVISGLDSRDSTSSDRPVPDYVKSLTGDVKGLRIGIPKEYFSEGMSPEVESSVRAAAATLVGRGAELVDVSLPHTQYAVGVYYLICTAEASSNLARYDGVAYGHRTKNAENIVDMFSASRSEGFGEEVKRRIMLGTYVLSAGFYDAYYLKASRVRTLIRRDFDNALKQCDIMLTPVCPTPAFKFGEHTGDPLQMYLSDIYTISLNLSALPGIALPCGKSSAGLPIGCQLIGRSFDEETLFRAAHALEQEVGVRDFELTI